MESGALVRELLLPSQCSWRSRRCLQGGGGCRFPLPGPQLQEGVRSCPGAVLCAQGAHEAKLMNKREVGMLETGLIVIHIVRLLPRASKLLDCEGTDLGSAAHTFALACDPHFACCIAEVQFRKRGSALELPAGNWGGGAVPTWPGHRTPGFLKMQAGGSWCAFAHRAACT